MFPKGFTMTDAPPRKPTIMEVARLADVSHQTVSRFFRAPDGLKPGTRARVEEAVRALDYRPNLVARSMRTRRTGRLAVVLPALTYNPARMLAGASAAAVSAGYAIDVVSHEGGISERTERVLDLAESGQVEGILSFAPLLPVIDRLAASTTVTVSADFDDSMRGVGALADGSPVRELVARLAELGHRRFLHVTGSLDFASARGRRDVYVQAVRDLGLESIGVVEGDWTGESGVAAIRGLDTQRMPTAVIAANDLVAAGVMRGIWERGLRVPDHISVTGWDDNAMDAFLTPTLTSVQVDLEGLGHDAMTSLIHALRGTAQPAHELAVHRIVWRESTAAPSLSA